MNASSSRQLLSRIVAASVLAVLASAASAAEPGKQSKFSAPKNEYGQPDLRGVWNFSSNTPFERPAKYKGREFMTKEEVEADHAAIQSRSEDSDNSSGGSGGVGGYNQFWVESLAQDANFRTSLLIDPPDGRLPALQPGLKSENGGLGPDTGGQRPVRFRVGGVRKDGPEDRGLSERCLMGFNSGPPFVPSMYNNNVQIFQTKDHAVIMTEMIHDARVVPLDKRPHLDPTLRQWSGDSRGHFEGDTLVVETRNFTDKTNVFRGAGSGKTMKLTERFTRVGKDRVDYQFTIDDPATFTKPFTALVPMVRTEGELFEYACHEGNYGMVNILQGARQEEREAAAKKPKAE
ncbi:MAG TPA: hypothetical protein VNA21_03735 [Steroidobacteraceae bacterium]|nr:hypothetical protein [Steroidobacteraceae bacterium]